MPLCGRIGIYTEEQHACSKSTLHAQMDVQRSLRGLLCEGGNGAVIDVSDKAWLVIEDLVAARVITLEIFIPEGQACRPIWLLKHLFGITRCEKKRRSNFKARQGQEPACCGMKIPRKGHCVSGNLVPGHQTDTTYAQP